MDSNKSLEKVYELLALINEKKREIANIEKQIRSIILEKIMRADDIKQIEVTKKSQPLKAIIFNGSLKNKEEDSNTNKLIKLVKKKYEDSGVKVKVVYLRNYRIAPGVSFETGDKWDEAKQFFDDINESDIVIMATPIWWGIQSSLISQLMERVGAYDDKYIKSGKTPLYNNVFGSIITASNDGFQHVQGNLYAFASNLGFTIPPEAHVFWGTYLGKEKNPVDNKETLNQIDISTRNIVLWASMIKSINLGDKALSDKTGRVGLDSNDKLKSTYG